jgi:hypothetical protein
MMSHPNNAVVAASASAPPTLPSELISPPEQATLSPSDFATFPESSDSSLPHPCSEESPELFNNAYNFETTIGVFPEDVADPKRFKTLYSTYVGVHKDQYAARINNLVKSKHCNLTISKTKPSNTLLGKEVVRCFKYFKHTGAVPCTANWTNKRVTEALTST